MGEGSLGPLIDGVPVCPLTSTMALQQAQMLLSMNSLESVNAGVQQNNTESFAVALCHLAELHAEQVGGGQAGRLLERGRLCQFFPEEPEKGTGHIKDRSGWPPQEK